MLKLGLFGRFRVEDDRGNEIPIKSRKARALLAYLASPLGKPRSRDAITALLWSERGDEQARGSLRQVLSGLRQDLGDRGAEALLVTHEDVALNPSHVIVNSPAPGDELLEGLNINDPAFDEWLRDERLRREDEARPERGQAAARGPNKPAIAVLPFANLSNDPEQEYFADGVTEDIMTELSRFGSLKVLARHSTFVLRDRAKDPREAVAGLGADYLLEGSVRRYADRLRLTAQLVDLDGESQIWAHRYDRELADVFAIQDELVHAIVTRLADRLTSAETTRSFKKPTKNLDAYDYYLRALNLDRRYTRECSQEAKSLLEKAIELDPSYARAHALLSSQIWTAPSFDGDLSKDDVQAAVEVSQKAVDLDPNDSWCHASLAVAYLQARNYERSGRHFELAYSLNPHDSFMWSDYAWYMTAVGRFEEAFELLQRREEVEPAPPDWHWDIRGHALFGLGRWKEAIDSYDQTSMLPVNAMAFLAACYGHLGDEGKAKEYWARFIEQAPLAKPEIVKEIAYCAQESDAELWLEGLRKAGIT